MTPINLATVRKLAEVIIVIIKDNGGSLKEIFSGEEYTTCPKCHSKNVSSEDSFRTLLTKRLMVRCPKCHKKYEPEEWVVQR